jgi:hypothetical protein
MPLPAALQNSHQNGGPVFLIFVADPRTVRLCTTRLQGLTAPLLEGRVTGCIGLPGVVRCSELLEP